MINNVYDLFNIFNERDTEGGTPDEVQEYLDIGYLDVFFKLKESSVIISRVRLDESYDLELEEYRLKHNYDVSNLSDEDDQKEILLKLVNDDLMDGVNADSRTIFAANQTHELIGLIINNARNIVVSLNK